MHNSQCTMHNAQLNGRKSARCFFVPFRRGRGISQSGRNKQKNNGRIFRPFNCASCIVNCALCIVHCALLKAFHKPVKALDAVFVALVNTCVFKDLFKYLADFTAENILGVFFCEGVISLEAVKPFTVLCENLVCGNILALKDSFSEHSHFVLES